MSTVTRSILYDPEARERRLRELLVKVRQSPDDSESMRELTELLPEEDGIPMETVWHRDAMSLLIEVISFHWRDRSDYFVGGNLFVYYTVEQAVNPLYRGPDFFVVKGVEHGVKRSKWVVWEEGDHYPDVIVELLSESTAETDRITKKDLYANAFQTKDYFIYDPEHSQIEGWRLNGGVYQSLEPNENGWLCSEELQLWIGNWTGTYLDRPEDVYPRFYHPNGELVLRETEANRLAAEQTARRADEEKRRADEEKRRADEEKRRADEETSHAASLAQEIEQLKQRVAELENKGGTE